MTRHSDRCWCDDCKLARHDDYEKPHALNPMDWNIEGVERNHRLDSKLAAADYIRDNYDPRDAE